MTVIFGKDCALLVCNLLQRETGTYGSVCFVLALLNIRDSLMLHVLMSLVFKPFSSIIFNLVSICCNFFSQ